MHVLSLFWTTFLIQSYIINTKKVKRTFYLSNLFVVGDYQGRHCLYSILKQVQYYNIQMK
jgi:hypothetical protein